MKEKQHIEIFSAGCPLCKETIKAVEEQFFESYEIDVLDMHDTEIAARAKELGVNAVPTVLVDGKIADCCSRGDIDIENLVGHLHAQQKELKKKLVQQHKLLD